MEASGRFFASESDPCIWWHMSRTNKVNPDHYKTAGRLSPDDLARERWKQQNTSLRRDRHEKPQPPWMRQQTAPQPDLSTALEEETPADAPVAPEPDVAPEPTRTAGPRRGGRRPARSVTATAKGSTKTSTRARKSGPKTRAAAAKSQTRSTSARRSRGLTEKRPVKRKRAKR